MMNESWERRIVAIGCLLAVLFMITIAYGMLTPAPALGAYPSEDELAVDYDAYTGEQVQVTGTVIATEPVVIAAEYDHYTDGQRHSGILDLTIHAVDTTVETGQVLQVYGSATPDQGITANRVIVVPSRNFRYMYTVSALAGLWVLGRLIRDWRIDWEQWTLIRREDPLDIRTVRTNLSKVVD